MIPGPYSICVASCDDSDGLDFHTLIWGYDTAAQAYAELAKVAAENEVRVEDCTVIRIIEREGASEFTR